jgi:hypothetical protein
MFDGANALSASALFFSVNCFWMLLPPAWGGDVRAGTNEMHPDPSCWSPRPAACRLDFPAAAAHADPSASRRYTTTITIASAMHLASSCSGGAGGLRLSARQTHTTGQRRAEETFQCSGARLVWDGTGSSAVRIRRAPGHGPLRINRLRFSPPWPSGLYDGSKSDIAAGGNAAARL